MKKILVVDDDASLLILFQMCLGSQFEVITAASGGMALNKLSKDLSLVLIDYDMPSLTGIALSEEILFRYPQLRIMIMSSHWYIEHDVITNSKAAGFIRKPCMDYSEILKNILQVINPAVVIASSSEHSNNFPVLFDKQKQICTAGGHK